MGSFGWHHDGATARSKGSGSGRRSDVPTEHENKAIFRRYVEEVVNQENLEIADEIFDHYLAHQPDGSVLERSPEDVKRFIGESHSAFQDLHCAIEDQIAEDDRVMTRWKMHGIHQRDFRGMPPTGEEVEINGIGIFRFSAEGKVVESWDSYDQFNLMRQSIEQELRMARDIQQALLPEDMPRLDGWNILHHYQPAREVGGDFYDFFELPEGRLGMVVGDATGHGMPAALVMATARSMIRAVSQTSDSPGEVLSGPTTRYLWTYPPTCSSRVCTLSSTLIAGGSSMPTPAMTYPTCAAVVAMQRN
jgi:predicted ester cyclase